MERVASCVLDTSFQTGRKDGQEGMQGREGPEGGTPLEDVHKMSGKRWETCRYPSTCPHHPHTSPLLPCAHLPSYGRVYAAADPYHHTIGPAATYSIGTMVRRLGPCWPLALAVMRRARRCNQGGAGRPLGG